MKTVNRSFKTVFAVVGIVLLIGTLVTACSKSDDKPPVDNRPYTISGNATGSQVVPAVSDSGTATITGTYNPSTRILNYTSNWTNLSGTPLAGGFYMGASGASGIAVGSGWSLSGGSTGTITGNVTLTEAEATQLMAGSLYYTYATSVNPSGEVRGQVGATR